MTTLEIIAKQISALIKRAQALDSSDVDGKIACYESVCDLNPGNILALNNLGYFYWKKAKHAKQEEKAAFLAKAKTFLETSLYVKPSAYGHYYYGLVSEAEGDEEKALAMYEEARNITIQQGEVFSWPSERYAELQLKRNAPRKAFHEYWLFHDYLHPPTEKDEKTGELKHPRRYVQEGITIDQTIIDAFAGKVNELRKRRRSAKKHIESNKTIDNYRMALEQWADSPTFHFEFAELLGESDLEKAIEHAEIALGLDPDSHAHVVYGRLLEKKAEHLKKDNPRQRFVLQEAVRAYRTAVERSFTDNYYTTSLPFYDESNMHDLMFGQRRKRHGAHERLVALYEALGLPGEAQKHRDIIDILNKIDLKKPETVSYTRLGEKPVLISVIHASESYALHTAYTLGQEGYSANLYLSTRESCDNNTEYEHALVDEMLKKHKHVGIISLHMHHSFDPEIVIPDNIVPRVYPYDLEIGTQSGERAKKKIKHGPSADDALLDQIVKSLDQHHVTHCENLSRYGGDNVGALKMRYHCGDLGNRADIIQLEFDPRPLAIDPTFMLSTVRTIAETMQRYAETK